MGKASNLLGTLSPLIGAITGKGLFGRLINGKEEEEEEKEKEEGNAGKVPQVASQGNQVTYKKGGSVTRADGAAKRGKTKGRTI